ncbi:MAG: S1 RNA-binding domain-containing protein, partial [Rhodocyclaceae bacterium]|nr:S1 RNA-binding domain-containing protein [Rhodocyclaceae bacterium]
AGRRLPARALDALGQHCSATERRADEATRDVTAWLKCHFMHERIGEIFDGSIASVVPFGLFVALDELYVEGLIHISDLGNDYFLHDEARHELRGERTGVRFRMGERLRVQLVRVSLETSKIDFRLMETLPATPKPRAAKATKSAKTTKPAKTAKSAKTAKVAKPAKAAKKTAAASKSAKSTKKTAPAKRAARKKV